jgi:hypothetical protein
MPHSQGEQERCGDLDFQRFAGTFDVIIRNQN